MKQGFDISYCQPEFDFDAAVQEGYEFCVIKMSQGRHDGTIYEDDYFQSHINDAIAAGLSVGVYHFFGATNPDDAKAEANAFISLYRSLVSPGVTDDVGVWLDVEAESGQVLDGVDSATLTASVFEFILTCNQAGIDIGIYGNYDWLTNRIDMTQFADYVKIWLSEPDGEPYWKDEHPERIVKIWQTSFNGSVGGTCPVDTDVMFDE